MKGLIYRQLYLSRKSLITGTIALLIVMLLEALVMLSLRVGNLSRVQDLESTRSTLVAFSMVVGTIVACGVYLNDHNVMQSDYTARWHIFTYTLPVSEERQALVFTGFTFLEFLVSICIGMLNMLMTLALSGEKFEMLYLIYVAMFSVYFLVIQLMKTPLMVLTHKESTANGISMAVCIGVLMLAMLRFSAWADTFIKAEQENGNEDDSVALKAMVRELNPLIRRWAWVIPVIFILGFAVSYFATVKLLKRRKL